MGKYFNASGDESSPPGGGDAVRNALVATHAAILTYIHTHTTTAMLKHILDNLNILQQNSNTQLF